MDVQLPEMQRPFGRDTLPQLKQLRGRHEIIIQMFVMGFSLKDISEELEISIEMADYTVNGDLGQARIAELRETAGIETAEIARHIHEGAHSAAIFLKEYVQNGNTPGKERMKAAIELLKMDGHGPITRVAGKIDHGFIGERGHAEILTRARELNIIDVDATPVESGHRRTGNGNGSCQTDAIPHPPGGEEVDPHLDPLPLPSTASCAGDENSSIVSDAGDSSSNKGE